MIENACILRHDQRHVNAANIESFTEVVSLAADMVRCFVGPITNSQRFTLGAVIENCNRVLYLPKANWTTVTPANGDRLLILVDGESQELSRIVEVQDNVMNDISHWAMFLKKA